jgi:hypothetical protein
VAIETRSHGCYCGRAEAVVSINQKDIKMPDLKPVEIVAVSVEAGKDGQGLRHGALHKSLRRR